MLFFVHCHCHRLSELHEKLFLQIKAKIEKIKFLKASHEINSSHKLAVLDLKL